jgi:hypothetical protein
MPGSLAFTICRAPSKRFPRYPDVDQRDRTERPGLYGKKGNGNKLRSSLRRLVSGCRLTRPRHAGLLPDSWGTYRRVFPFIASVVLPGFTLFLADFNKHLFDCPPITCQHGLHRRGNSQGSKTPANVRVHGWEAATGADISPRASTAGEQ